VSNFAPDGYFLSTGTWNTDAQRNQTTFLSGDSSIEFIQGTTLTSLVAQEYTPVPVDRERSFQVAALIQQYGGTGGGLYIGAKMYDQNRIFTRNSSNFFTIAAAGVWTNIGNNVSVLAGETFMRPYIRKDAVNVGYYIDRMWPTPVPGHDHTAPSGAWSQVIPSGAAWNTITNWGALRNGGLGFSYSAGDITAMYSGVACVNATICWDNATAAIGDYYEMRIEWLNWYTSSLLHVYGNATPVSAVPASGGPIRQIVSATIPIESGNAIRIQVRQQTGGNRNVVCAANPSSSDWSSFHVSMLH